MVSARCSLCVKVGRTILNSLSAKRIRNQNVQYYKISFPSDNMMKHAEQQHPEAVAEYLRFGDGDKMTYFDRLIAINNSLLAHFDG